MADENYLKLIIDTLDKIDNKVDSTSEKVIKVEQEVKHSSVLAEMVRKRVVELERAQEEIKNKLWYAAGASGVIGVITGLIVPELLKMLF